MADAPSEGGRVCDLCVELMGDEAHVICPPHDESTQRLAYAFAAAFQPPPITVEKASWFIEDAENVVGPDLQEGIRWEVVTLPDLRGGVQSFTVNGKQFWIDPNAEGYNPPQPIEQFPFEDEDDDEPTEQSDDTTGGSDA